MLGSKKKHRSKKNLKQKLMGFSLIVICVLIFCIASTGNTLEERDCTAALLIAPLGLYLIFSKQVVIW